MSDPAHPLGISPVRVAVMLLLSLAPSVAGSWLWARSQAPAPYWPGLFAGWGVALALGLPSLWVKQKSLCGDLRRFLPWTLGGNALRALILLVIVVAVRSADVANSGPFLVAAVSGYLCCLAGEVVLLHRTSQRIWNTP